MHVSGFLFYKKGGIKMQSADKGLVRAVHAWLDSAQLKEEEGGVARLGVSLPLRRPL